MSLFGSLEVSASALAAERVRLDVAAENLANANTTRSEAGGPYRRRVVVLQEARDPSASFGSVLGAAMAAGRSRPRGLGGVEVAQIAQDPAPNRRVYDPGHPDADGQGYVELPNVNPVTEMVDLITASRAYEANVTALGTAKAMFNKTLELLR